MATVSTETIYCFHHEFKRVVRYKSRYGQFFITLPAEVPEAEVSADTEGGAIKLFDAAIAVHEKSSTEVSKVILYGYEVDACIRGPNDKRGRISILFDSQDEDNCNYGKTFCDDGMTVSLWAKVCEKSEVILEELDNYVNYEELESPLPDSLDPKGNKSYHRHYDDFQEIPWTLENEQFFIDIGRAFEQLILRLNSVLGDKKKVMEFIASGQNLLAAPDETKG